MQATPIFPTARARAGMYESFYLRAFSPTEPLGVWIRHTVHKRPGMRPTGSIWCTVFDARRQGPFMTKSSSAELEVPAAGWISIGGQTSIGPGIAEGACGEASWSLRFAGSEPPLRHLKPEWLYRMPLPRTKLTSPAPAAVFSGTVEVPGSEPIALDGWPGMVGHNWGSEHAERWIWLHGAGFSQAPEAWLDVALGRILIGGRMTPWLANGVLSLDGARHRIGGLLSSRPRVHESVAGCSVHLAGEGGLGIELRARVPAGLAAGWRYADPDGGEHDVVNCSLAALELDVLAPGRPTTRELSTPHGGAYELGMREHDHGVAIAPFADG
jgi:hypothetical protein